MKFCIGQFFSIVWRWSGKLLTKSTCPRSWSFFSDWMTCSISLGWLFRFFNCWLYTLMALFIYFFLGGGGIISLIIVGLCSSGNLAIVWRLVRSTFTDWFIMYWSTSCLMLVNSIWSWSLHVLHDRQLIHLYMTSLPASSAWLNTFLHFTTKASSIFSYCSLLKLYVKLFLGFSISNNGNSGFTWYAFIYNSYWFQENVSCMVSCGWYLLILLNTFCGPPRNPLPPSVFLKADSYIIRTDEN